ncbi:hypothetical protein SBRCBS47491_008662 [Sporothrix bragantina]|uniref:DUF7053 domain-containing protein n=1 Tax=Sporothrix bragantina TaxID=671064 RepID=A0ABP0CNC4_9PEZI
MKSSTTTNRLSAPMSKRINFTTITPLPPNIGRASVVSFLHNYEAMIDINPLVADRYRIPPPRDADPDEAACVWYQLTDAVAMPWSVSSPTTGADSMAAKPKSGNVSYTCAFHPLSDGLQTHCRAPLGVDIRDRWTVGGNEPGEPRQPAELGLKELGAPASGLYLREDVDLRCNRLMSGFVKKTLKKSHETLVQKLNSDLASAGSPVVKSPINESSSLSATSPILAQRPTPFRVYPQQNQRQQRRRPDPQDQYQAFQPQPEQLKIMQQQRLQQLRPQSQQYPPPYPPPPYSPSQAHQHYQQHRQQQQQYTRHSYRQHQHSQSYPQNVPARKPAPSMSTSVPASLAVGPPSSQQTFRQTQQQNQQNQQNQRTLHPHFPQHDKVESASATAKVPPLSSSPSKSEASVSTTWTASTTTTALSTSSSPCLSSSPLPSPRPSPPTVHYDRFKLTASPLTRLQLQLPKASAFAPPPMVDAAEMSVSLNDIKITGNELFTEKEQRHSLYQQLLPPLVFSAREVVASESRRKSTGSEATSASAKTSNPFVVDSLPFQDLSLCPQPLRIGGQRRASAGQSSQQKQTIPTPQSLTLMMPEKTVSKPAVQSQLEQTYLPFQPSESSQKNAETVEEPAKAVTESRVKPAEQSSLADIFSEYPEMNPYVYNEDDYEDIYVDTPILASDDHTQHNGPYSPTVFAELDNATKGSSEAKTIESVVEATAPVPEWQQWRQFLSQDMD